MIPLRFDRKPMTMNQQSPKTTGISLLIGSLLMFITMLLHPGAGGGLTEGYTFAIVSHGLAIFSVPFSLLGFWGLAQVLQEDAFLSRIALSIMIIGLFAAVMAASLNGLAMPMFALGMKPEWKELADPIFAYNRSLNHAFDYILITAMFISTFLWSVSILRLKVLPTWLGYLGISLFVIGITAIVAGFYVLDVGGFRTLIYGWAIWIVGVGFRLLEQRKVE